MLAHEHARELLARSCTQWHHCLQQLCASANDDASASRDMLLATLDLEKRRCEYDRALMLALPQAWAREYDEHWHCWLEWNKQLERMEYLMRLTRPHGPLDEVWSMCGVQLLS